jgi:transaldolase
VLYVEQLIAPGVVNTMPQATLEAFDDHGNAQFPPIDVGDPAGDLAGVDLRAAGVDLDRITTALEREGVEAFSSSYEQLVSCIRRKLRNLVP